MHKTNKPCSVLASRLFKLAVLNFCWLAAMAVWGQGSAFTYQGSLAENGAPATGLYDMSFSLYSASTGGSPIGTQAIAAVPVTNGLFQATLDFGNPNVNFDGTD